MHPNLICMKKKISKILLLSACFILLAHAIIPHHSHYNRPVCFYGAFNIEHCDHYDHYIDHQSHECCGHHHGVDHGLCVISDFFSPRQVQELDIHLDIDLFSFISTDFIFIDNSIVPTELTGLPFRQRPFIFTYHDASLIYFSGLRAPPVC